MVRRIVSQVWGLAPLEPANSPSNIKPQVLEVGKTLIAKPENIQQLSSRSNSIGRGRHYSSGVVKLINHKNNAD